MPPRAALLLLGALAACSAARRPDFLRAEAEVVARHVAVKESGFDPYVQFDAPRVNDPRLRGSELTWSLRGWRDRGTGKQRHQLRVYVEYPGVEWRLYDRSLASGATAPLSVIDRSLASCLGQDVCRYREAFGVDLSTSALLAAVRTGLLVAAVPRDEVAVTTLSVPAAYVRGYLSAMGLAFSTATVPSEHGESEAPSPVLPANLPGLALSTAPLSATATGPAQAAAAPARSAYVERRKRDLGAAPAPAAGEVQELPGIGPLPARQRPARPD